MKKSVVIALHCCYWLMPISSAYFSLYALEQIKEIEQETASHLYHNAISNVSNTLFSIIVFYLFYLYLFPKFIAKKRIALFILCGLIACFTCVFIKYESIRFASLTFVPKKYKFPDNSSYYIPFEFFRLIGTAATGCFVRAFINWYSDISFKEQLMAKNLQSELALLRAQINPHFLFNTINNIDVLIAKDAEAASQYLQQLSDIMRFMLYETSTERILLTKEIAYIRKYIALQKIRTANENYVQFSVTGMADDISIAPMIFIPFIENAFKHSINKKIDHAIAISIAITGGEITFICKNAYDYTNISVQEQSGLGIELIKQRLHLLYHNQHQLDIKKLEREFIVTLNITIL
ncbi:MAG: histidine kinase [Flavobacterium sp.]|nr:histidine kinase [Flavobacterium sp.]